jgi:hypothetical protein
MEMDLNNRLTEDETLEQAYDIFLELAVDNLDPADVILFNLQKSAAVPNCSTRQKTGPNTWISTSILISSPKS